MAALDAERLAVRKAYQMIAEHSFPKPERGPFHLSSKVESLLQTLRKHLDPANDKCIVFVEQRITAMLLADLLKQPSMNMLDIKAGVLVSFFDLNCYQDYY